MKAARRMGFALAIAAGFLLAPAGGASAAMPRIDAAKGQGQGTAHAVTWKKKHKWRHGTPYRHHDTWYYNRGYRKHGSPIPYGYTYVRPLPRVYVYRYHPYVYHRPYVRVRPFTRGWYGRRHGGYGYRW